MKNIIKKERVQLSSPAGAPRAARPAPAEPRGPVRLIHAGGRVAAIEVTCGCGRVSLIELEYEGDPARDRAS